MFLRSNRRKSKDKDKYNSLPQHNSLKNVDLSIFNKERPNVPELDLKKVYRSQPNLNKQHKNTIKKKHSMENIWNKTCDKVSDTRDKVQSIFSARKSTPSVFDNSDDEELSDDEVSEMEKASRVRSNSETELLKRKTVSFSKDLEQEESSRDEELANPPSTPDSNCGDDYGRPSRAKKDVWTAKVIFMKNGETHTEQNINPEAVTILRINGGLFIYTPPYMDNKADYSKIFRVTKKEKYFGKEEKKPNIEKKKEESSEELISSGNEQSETELTEELFGPIDSTNFNSSREKEENLEEGNFMNYDTESNSEDSFNIGQDGEVSFSRLEKEASELPGQHFSQSEIDNINH